MTTGYRVADMSALRDLAVKFVVNAQGKKKAVLLDYKVWQSG